jgi:hypothetical protein
LLAAALRAGRREEGGGAGATTNVLASTASGDVQPRAWLAAAIRSGAGVTPADASATGLLDFAVAASTDSGLLRKFSAIASSFPRLCLAQDRL